VTYLHNIADLASIVTAISVLVGLFGYLGYRRRLWQRTRAIEKLLEWKKDPGDDSLMRSQLAGHFGLTEEQVIEAAGRSKKIEPWTGQSGNEYRYRYKRAR
jgi:hypothetical protein